MPDRTLGPSTGESVTMAIREALTKLCRREHLTPGEAQEALLQVLRGEASAPVVAAYLTALRVLGETSEEIAGSASALLEHSVRLPISGEGLVDTCGTGGDASGTYNLSTAAAFIATGAGCRIAKHGNRSVSSRCGSADVLEVLGVKIDLPPDRVAACIDKAGMGFLFAPLYHPGMKHVMGPRRELGVGTIFNVLGPICNPARPTRQVVGVYHEDFLEKVGQALRGLGSRRAWVIHGSQGLDEASPGGTTQVYAISPEQAHTFAIRPEDHGLPMSTLADLAGGTAMENAQIIQGVLEGKPGPKRDAAVLNAALVIQVTHDGLTLAEALDRAREAVDSERALQVLKTLRAVSHA